MAAAITTDKRGRTGTEQQRVPIPRQARRSQADSFASPGRATDRQVRLALHADVETGNAVRRKLGPCVDNHSRALRAPQSTLRAWQAIIKWKTLIDRRNSAREPLGRLPRPSQPLVPERRSFSPADAAGNLGEARQTRCHPSRIRSGRTRFRSRSRATWPWKAWLWRRAEAGSRVVHLRPASAMADLESNREELAKVLWRIRKPAGNSSDVGLRAAYPSGMPGLTLQPSATGVESRSPADSR